MRRSLAPSQVAGTPVAKRPRVELVALKNPLPTYSSTVGSSSGSTSTGGHSTASNKTLELSESRFKASNSSTNFKSITSVPKATPLAEKNGEQSKELEEKQYSVFWCKASGKKHKNWEEEAILVVKGRGVVLKSMEGKVIGQATGFKLTELSELENGSTLKVGSREVLIQELITETQISQRNNTLNRPYDGKSTDVNVPPRSSSSQQANKEFVAPLLKDGAKAATKPPTTVEIKPRYNPSSPNAFVMPRPPLEMQLREKQNGVTIVDVVVDPLLSKNLRPHQRDGVVFLYECVMGYKIPNMYGAILADEMGLGKTLQCITVVWILLQQGPFNGRPVIQRVLIVTPSSLVKNWEKEFRRWLGRERITVFTADQQNRPIEFLKHPLCPVMVVSYEMLLRCFDEIQQVNFDLVVCDEGHRLKNAGNKTSLLLSQLDTCRKILLSGTPVQNDLKEFYALADFVNPGVLGSVSGVTYIFPHDKTAAKLVYLRSILAFRRNYEEPIVALQQPECNEEQREIGESSANDLAQITSQFVLRRTQEVMNAHLPPKVESVVFCKPTSAQVRLYRSMLDSSAVQSFLSSSHGGNDLLSFIQSLRKLCNHPILFTTPPNDSESDNLSDNDLDSYEFDESSVLDMMREEGTNRNSSGKFVVTVMMLEAVMNTTSEKVILVSYSTKMLDLFEEVCKEKYLSFLRLDGSTPTNLRMGLVERFNDPHGPDRIFLLSSKAGGVGLNLIGASRLILYDIDWNPANDMQAMARIWREGQKKKVQIYRLLTTGTIEEKIFQRQILKQGLSGTIVDARESTQGHFTKEELKDLFTLRQDTDCDTHDLIGCDCTIKNVPKIPLGIDDYDFDVDDEPLSDFIKTTRKEDKTDGHKTVDQLMEWQHHGPPFSPKNFNDICLEAALKHVTFVLRCESGLGN